MLLVGRPWRHVAELRAALHVERLEERLVERLVEHLMGEGRRHRVERRVALPGV